jgi:hypothetical protein
MLTWETRTENDFGGKRPDGEKTAQDYLKLRLILAGKISH